MDRRNFLGTSASSAVAAAAIGLGLPAVARTVAEKKQSSKSKQHILILGAGASALTAALALEKVGHKTTLIEYQDRVGGRVWSKELKGGQYTELGAGHFRGNMPYVGSYIKHFKLPIVTLNDGLPRYLLNNKAATAADLSNWPWKLHESERGVGLPTQFQAYLSQYDLDADLVIDPNFLENPKTLARFDNETVGSLLKKAGASDEFIALIGVHCGGGSPFDEPALVGLPDIAYHFGDQFCYKIRGGNDLLTTAMANALEGNIELNSPVNGVIQNGSKIIVTCENGKTFTGDQLISTIPPSVLNKVTFKPGLTALKKKAFSGLQWVQTIKVVCQSNQPTWLTAQVHGWPMAASDQSWERIIDITGNDRGAYGYGNTFIYLNNQDNQDSLRKYPIEQRASRIISLFQKDNPDLLDKVVFSEYWDWESQPWIKASLGFVKLGRGSVITELQKSDGRIHWAGDWTTLKTGWVEGAIESGLRAARAIDPSAPFVTTMIRAEQAC
ncbi:flavin monoamine oxidase family protein [Synechococcus sp. A10-1-5-9]|uniref:flavin monoamine oxidase family protein n=1 Tax=Synechococcus sp. A10-1-5-9 TaxID=3392295 RepID=UPI0039E881F7